MEPQELSQSTITILAAYLPYLWHDNVPTTGDQKRWQAARALWQTLRPCLDALPGGARIVWSAVEGTDTDREHLGADLTILFEQNTELRSAISRILADSPFAGVARSVGRSDAATQSDLLRRAIQYPVLADTTPATRQVAEFLKALLAVIVVGMIIGMLDFVITFALSELLGNTASMAGVILSWTPFLLMCFVGGVLLRRILIRALVRSRTHQRPLALCLALIASALAVYAIPTGSLWMEVLMAGPLLQTFGSLLDTLRGISWIFTTGGADLLIDYADSEEYAYLAVLSGLLFFYVINTARVAGRITEYFRQRLRQLQKIGQPVQRWSVGSGWLSFAVLIAVFALLFWLSLYRPLDPPGDPGGPFGQGSSESAS